MQAATTAIAPIRRLTWQSSVPIEVRLAAGAGEPSGSGGVERYYIQAPRYTFLPLLIREIKENFVQLAIHEDDLVSFSDDDWWFEEDLEWEVGTGNDSIREPCRWHWPIDLIHLNSQIRHPLPSTSTCTTSTPLRLILHLTPAPQFIKDKLILSPSVESLKSQYMTALKEADFVRWGHTRRITGLRRMDLESGWNGIVDVDYEAHSRFASKIFPLPFLNPTPDPVVALQSTSTSTPSRPASTDPSGIGSSALSSASGKPDSVYASRAIPMRVYLPDGAPVVQEVVPPLSLDGKPTTVIQFLRQHLPLLFPTQHKPSSTTTQHDPNLEFYPLAVPILQGVILPPDAELGWLSCGACGPDGWLRIGVQLRAV